MNLKKLGLLGLTALLLISYNMAQPSLVTMRATGHDQAETLRNQARDLRGSSASNPQIEKLELRARQLDRQSYGPSMAWLDRLMNANSDKNKYVKLDFNVLSSMMIAGLASGFKSQVANLLWMKSDEYWHQGLLTRQVPLMEAVVTLDPQFIDAWSTAGWHWSYNIYADIELDPRYKDLPKQAKDKIIRQKQDQSIDIGLDYLKRGSEMNPDTYRLWFEHGWTRGEKAGYYDEETVSLFRRARAQADARNVERDEIQGGKTVQVTEQGLDIIGRTIGHVYEKTPNLDAALNQYAGDLLKATPQQRALLDANGKYWRYYGSEYTMIAQLYQSGDATTKAQIKALVPDAENLVKAVKMRDVMAGSQKGGGSQPTGAYVSIAARYIPAWKMMKAGNVQGAIKDMIGVMNADPRYTLQGLPVLAKLMELRGDAPAIIKGQLEAARQFERGSSQDIGLHFLATLYERAASQAQNAQERKAYRRLAYETWYRARERDTLDFYAKRRTRFYEDQDGFTTPLNIVAQVKAARKSGTVNAAPAAPPNVGSYYDKHEAGEHDHETRTPELPKELQ